MADYRIDAQRLRELRKLQGLSRARLSELSGVSAIAILKLESGEHTEPRTTTIAALARALGVKYTSLLHSNGDAELSPDGISLAAEYEKLPPTRRAEVRRFVRHQLSASAGAAV